MSTPSLRQLEYAVALAEHLHFGDAADQVNVTQPALSAQIRELESRLGVELFERTTTGTLLTSAGADVVTRAHEILRAVAELELVAEAHRHVAMGELRIAAIPTLAPYVLPSILEPLRSEWPDAHIVIEELQSKALLTAMDTGELDLGVLATPYDTGRLHVEVLGTEPFQLAVPEDHPLAAGDGSLPLDVLADLRLLLLPEGHCLRDHALQACEIAGRAEHSEVKASSIATLVQMVASGMGATLLPACAESVEARSGSGIRTRRFVAPAPGRNIALVWRASDPRGGLFAAIAPRLRANIQAIVAGADET